MGKNNPESVVTRVEAEEDQFRGETRYFPGPGPMEAFPNGFSGGFAVVGRAKLRDKPFEAKGSALCSGDKPKRLKSGVDFGDAIGKELQSLYDDIVAQPVPDRFLSLLDQLEKNMVSSGLSNDAPEERE